LQKWRFIPADASLEKDVPAAPTALEVEEQSGSLKLSWTASSSTDVAGYVVLRAEGANSTSWNVIGRMIDKTEFIDYDVKGGRSYRYKVKAIDYSRNQSEASDPYFINTGNTTGVEELETTDMESVPFTYYTLDGIQLSAPQKGFNLIKMSDGQVKKVWVK